MTLEIVEVVVGMVVLFIMMGLGVLAVVDYALCKEDDNDDI